MVVTRGGLDGMKLAGQDASVGGSMSWLEEGGVGLGGRKQQGESHSVARERFTGQQANQRSGNTAARNQPEESQHRRPWDPHGPLTTTIEVHGGSSSDQPTPDEASLPWATKPGSQGLDRGGLGDGWEESGGFRLRGWRSGVR